MIYLTYGHFLNIIKNSVYLSDFSTSRKILNNENHFKYFIIGISTKGRCIDNENDISA